MERPLTIALAQSVFQLGDVSYNLANIVNLIREAADNNADIVIFPELCFTGYQMDVLGSKVHSLSDLWQDRIEQAIQEVTAECGIYAIVGQAVRRGRHFVNAARLFDRNGILVGEYCKNFIFEKEKQFFKPHNQLPVFDTDFGKAGILICYDIGFPETARALALAGAEVIFIIASWRAQDEHAWNLNVASRALENQCFTAAVNHAGQYDGLCLFGRSMVVAPDGRPVLQLAYDRQMLGICTIDINDISRIRREIGYLSDLKASGRTFTQVMK